MLSIMDMAGTYYLGLFCGYFSIKDVIRWVDDVIDKSESPISNDLIELSLSERQSTADVGSKLLRILQNEYTDRPMNIILGLCYKKLVLAPENDDVMLYLYRLSKQSSLPSDYINNSIISLSDEFYLATEGIYGDRKVVVSDMIGFLEPFEVYANGFLEEEAGSK